MARAVLALALTLPTCSSIDRLRPDPPPAATWGSAPAGVPSPPVPAPPPGREGAAADDAFWRRLADCECASGSCGGGHLGWFQFSPDTAAKVGIDGSEGYEEQRAAAIEWARRIHPREGTTSGWPHCWWAAA